MSGRARIPANRAGSRARLPLAAAALLLAGSFGCVQAGQLEPALAALAQSSPRNTSAVVIELEGARPIEHYAAQLAALPRTARPGRLAALMRADFDAAAAPVLAEIQAVNGFGVQPLWIAHSIALQVARGRLAQLAALPGVKLIESDLGLRSVATRRAAIPVGKAVRVAPFDGPAGVVARPTAPSQGSFEAFGAGQALNLPAHFLSLDVPSAWQRGLAGQGVTVAVVDSGVDLHASAIAKAYRGGAGGWFDPYAQQRNPTDISGHGTLVAGLLVGGLVDDTPIGVAPKSRWIAARLFDDTGKGSASAVQRIYQWLLDPDGDPVTNDAPDIVNNSWGLPQTVGRCNTAFARALAALRAADIHVVFAAGNDGPADSTSMSPANNPGVLSVGALTAERSIAERSSRGPSGCGSAPFPSMYAPGINLPALDQIAVLTGSAAIADGTSFAAAALSGALAVLRSAAPLASAAELEALLLRTARREGAQAPSKAGTLLSPDLGAALAALNLPAAAARPAAPVLRWKASAEAADKPLDISPAGLRTVLPWSADPMSIKPAAMPATGRLQQRGEGWAYQPDATKPATVRFDVATRDGRRLVVELVPASQLAANLPQPQRRAVQTAANNPVMIDLDAKGKSLKEDALLLSSPVRGGKVRLLGKGQVQYTPPVNFIGTDQFSYSSRGDKADASARTTVMVKVVQQ